MRCFVAVDIDKELKAKIAQLQEYIVMDGIKLIPPENLHFTLKFLGELDEAAVDNVKTLLKGIKQEKIDILLVGVGAFPKPDYIKVIWVGAPKLTNLQSSVNEVLKDISPLDRNIKPHLTIARVRFVKDTGKIAKFLREQKEVEMGKMTVKEIILKKSTLVQKGPVYENISSFPLKS